MFGMKIEDVMKEDDKPVVSPSPTQQFWETPKTKTAPRSRRKWIIASMIAAIVSVGGLAIAGTQMDRPRTELIVTAKAEVAKEQTKEEVIELPPLILTPGKPTNSPGWIDSRTDNAQTVQQKEPPKQAPEAKPTVKVESKHEAKPEIPAVVAPASKTELKAPTKASALATAPVDEKKPDVAEKKPRKAVIEEPDENPPRREVYDIFEDAKEAAKKNGKPLIIWTGDLRLKAPKNVLDELNPFFTQFTGKYGNSDSPRIEFTGADGFQYIIRPPLTENTAKKIKLKFGLVSYKELFPQIEYPKNYRNRNVPIGGGCCVWASGSNLAYYHGYDFRLENNLRGGSSPWALHDVLKKNKIPSVWTAPGRNNIKYLRDVCDSGLGACVGVQMMHYINVAGVSDTHVAILDNNGPLVIRKMPVTTFMRYWDGTSNVITPPGKSEGFLAKYKVSRWGQINPNSPRDLSDEHPGADGMETGMFYGNSKPTPENRKKMAAFWKDAGMTAAEIDKTLDDFWKQ